MIKWKRSHLNYSVGGLTKPYIPLRIIFACCEDIFVYEKLRLYLTLWWLLRSTYWLLFWNDLEFFFTWCFNADWNAGSSYCCSLDMFMWRKTLPYMNKWKICLVSSVHHLYGQQAGLAPPWMQSKGRRPCKYKQWELWNPWNLTRIGAFTCVTYGWWRCDVSNLSCMLHFVHASFVVILFFVKSFLCYSFFSKLCWKDCISSIWEQCTRETPGKP
jgi:hypothetical protein